MIIPIEELAQANLEYRVLKKYRMDPAGDIVRLEDGAIMDEARPLFVCREDGSRRYMAHGSVQMLLWHYREALG